MQRATRRWLWILGAYGLIVIAGGLIVVPMMSARSGAPAWTLWGMVVRGAIALALTPVTLWFLVRGFIAGVRAVRAQKRRLDLRCPGCNFDVTGQFRAGVDRCPECGMSLGLSQFREP